MLKGYFQNGFKWLLSSLKSGYDIFIRKYLICTRVDFGKSSFHIQVFALGLVLKRRQENIKKVYSMLTIDELYILNLKK